MRIQWVSVHDRAIRRHFSPGSGKLDSVCTGGLRALFLSGSLFCVGPSFVLTQTLILSLPSLSSVSPLVISSTLSLTAATPCHTVPLTYILLGKFEVI